MAESRSDDVRPGSTAPPDVPLSRVRAARAARRAFFVLVCGIVLAGLLGFLGNRSATAQASAGGFDLKARYPSITRPGVPIDVTIEVRREGGFRGTLTVAVTSDYLDIFDTNGMDPDAESATTTADQVRWQFQTPSDADTMAISLDARIQPDVELRRAKGTVAVLDERGTVVVSVPIKTLVLA